MSVADLSTIFGSPHCVRDGQIPRFSCQPFSDNLKILVFPGKSDCEASPDTRRRSHTLPFVVHLFSLKTQE